MIKAALALYGVTALFGGAWLYQHHLIVTPGVFILGVIVFGFGLWLFCKQVAIFNSTQKTYGRLVSWGEERPPNPNSPKVYYYAHVVLQTRDGSEHHVASTTGNRGKPKTPIGHPMPVRYDPSNPDDARLDTYFDFWGPSTIIMFFGAVPIVVSFALSGHSPQLWRDVPDPSTTNQM
jgi:hypothetical protein